MKINWKQKLSSRKFWLAVAGFVGAVLAAFRVQDNTAVQVTAVISSVGVIAAYIFGESYTDGKRAGSATVELTEWFDIPDSDSGDGEDKNKKEG